MSRQDLTDGGVHDSMTGGAGDGPVGRARAGLVIETPRLLLRAPGPADAAAICDLADTPRVAENLLGMPHPYRLADALAWIADEPPGGGQKHLVWLKSVDGPPRAIGAATLDFRRGASLPTLGCWLGEGFWDRGFSTEACHAVIDYAFLHQGHERLSFTCRVTNGAGRRVIEKCGFQWAGQELGHSLFHRAVVAVDRFQLDRKTWEGLRRWEPLRFARGDRNPAATGAGPGGRTAAEV